MNEENRWAGHEICRIDGAASSGIILCCVVFSLVCQMRCDSALEYGQAHSITIDMQLFDYGLFPNFNLVPSSFVNSRDCTYL